MRRELFRLRVASKRQVTVPQRLLNVLKITEGDEIQIEVDSTTGRILAAEPCKAVPNSFVTPELLAAIEERERQFDKDEGHEPDLRSAVNSAPGMFAGALMGAGVVAAGIGAVSAMRAHTSNKANPEKSETPETAAVHNADDFHAREEIGLEAGKS